MKKSKQKPKLRKYPDGGKPKLNPYITNDPNDPRLSMYNDSLSIANISSKDVKYFKNTIEPLLKTKLDDDNYQAYQLWKERALLPNSKFDKPYDRLSKANKKTPKGKEIVSKYDTNFAAYKFSYPKQEVIYQPEEKILPEIKEVKKQAKSQKKDNSYRIEQDKSGNKYYWLDKANGQSVSISEDAYNNKFGNGGKKLNPYIATDPNDPRIQNYSDSLLVSKASDRDLANVTKDNTIDYNTSMSQTMAWNSGAKGKAHARLSKLSPTGFHEAESSVRPSYTGTPAVMKDKGYIAKYPAPKQEVIYQPKSVVSAPKAPVMPVNAPIKNVQTDLPQTVTYGKSNLGQPYSQTGSNKTWLTQGEADKIPYFQYKMGGRKLPKYNDGGKVWEGVKDTGLFLVDNMLSEWAPNAIKTPDYSGSEYSKEMAKVTATHEAFDSQSPVSKGIAMTGMQDPNSGRSAESQEYYDAALPIAKTGSSIGESYATQGLTSAVSSGGKEKKKETDYNNTVSPTYDPYQAAAQETDVYNPSDPNRDFAYGGVNLGIPNAEVETIETMNTAPGSITAGDYPTHAMGGGKVNLPTGTKMLSDRIINPETKNTFAEDGNRYTTDKEDKVKNDINSTGIAKFTANLKSQTKQFMHDKLFQAQEAIKQAKLKLGMQRLHKRLGIEMPEHQMPNGEMMPDYEMRMGGKMCYPNGGTKLPQYYDAGLTPMELPEDPQFRSQQDWYFPQPNTPNTPRFAQPSNPGLPILSRAEQEQMQWEDMNRRGIANSTPEPVNPVSDGTYENMVDKDIADGVYKPSERSRMTDDQKSNTMDNIGLGANILGQNAGNIADLWMTRGGKKYDKENSGQLTSQRYDATQALNDADIQNAVTRGALASASGGNAGAYMRNAIEAGSVNTTNKGRIRAAYEDKNIGLHNKDLYHNQQIRMLDKSNEQQNKARSEDISRKAFNAIGENTNAAFGDYRRGKMDQKSLDLIASAYPDYFYDKKKNGWYHKSTKKKLEATA